MAIFFKNATNLQSQTGLQVLNNVLRQIWLIFMYYSHTIR
jgi:hypothetical protein